MNREVIFRGKRIDNRDWVYGYYCFRRKRRGAFGQTITELDHDAHYIVNVMGESIEVEPATVGQFTGLSTRFGNRIYEHDIVKHYDSADFGDYEHYDVGHICWSNERCRWERSSLNRRTPYYDLSSKCFYEIIGNLFDNPELLNVKE